MIQSVNLYGEALRGRVVRWPLRQLALGLAGLAVVLLAWAALEGWRAHGAAEARIALAAELEAARAEQTRLSAALSARRADPELAAGNAERADTLARKSALLRFLGGQQRTQAEGFSALLAGLARQRVEGLWLTRITIADGGDALALTGRTLDEDHVPSLIAALAAEPGYDGREFTTFNLDRDPERARELRFALASSCETRSGEALLESDCAMPGGAP
jgi:Tfp pilus assembly protein PilN